MNNKIQFYVFGGGLGYKPARMVGETKTTISVAFKTLSGEEEKFTFKKRKIHGQDKYEDPRADLVYYIFIGDSL